MFVTRVTERDPLCDNEVTAGTAHGRLAQRGAEPSAHTPRLPERRSVVALGARLSAGVAEISRNDCRAVTEADPAAAGRERDRERRAQRRECRGCEAPSAPKEMPLTRSFLASMQNSSVVATAIYTL